MSEVIRTVNTTLFDGICPEDRIAMLGCIDHHISTYKKGQVIALEGDNIRHVGVVLSGRVDMVKEDIWGNKTLLIRMGENEIFGETFAWGEDTLSVVTFLAAEDTKILFMAFCRVMNSCSKSCPFHHRLAENMVRIIANKNRDLMRKTEVVSKRSIREKLLAYLSIQAQAQQSRYFQIPLGRIELAQYLCVDRSALTRELAKMREEGILDYDKDWFRLN